MPSIEQMRKGSIATAIFRRLKGTRYELDKERCNALARFHDDPKWIPALQKLIDGKFPGSQDE